MASQRCEKHSDGVRLSRQAHEGGSNRLDGGLNHLHRTVENRPPTVLRWELATDFYRYRNTMPRIGDHVSLFTASEDM